jgi:hypothetical protein
MVPKLQDYKKGHMDNGVAASEQELNQVLQELQFKQKELLKKVQKRDEAKA